jgi:hypothetical protein
MDMTDCGVPAVPAHTLEVGRHVVEFNRIWVKGFEEPLVLESYLEVLEDDAI